MRAFFKIIRWENLVVIILAQSFLHFLLLNKLVQTVGYQLQLSILQLGMLILSSVLIAAAGNVYNDILDLEVDKINKPKKLIVPTRISLDKAKLIYGSFSAIGFSLAVILAFQLDFYQLAAIQFIVILLLRLYSRQLKRSILVGNLLIAFLTAFSVFIVYLYNLVGILNDPITMAGVQKQLPFIFNLTAVYVVFAFISNLIRELIKDAEDIQGDKIFGFQTFAVHYGVQRTAVLARIFNAVLAIGLLGFTYYSFSMDWYYLGVYLVVALLVPLIYFELSAQKAKSKQDFHALSDLSKIIMVAGILSMQVFSMQF
ncbi:MAG: geranylgeranylglycerol-phosphate geranylgeranyltransferase [Bacteroidales bacterium]|nr:geranylgeranylglycerol-phosphate geranylgeranyltransferase [Bacteroidales bacterium]